ncbi:polyamine deacetylase HDAC10 isoform X1 [Mirounga angustirostris]|uniref:polyamine deacetylase HDAC10 isoform X1 n=1 Tax=Mirounga angustirostris TaxID=9716 RepID=UPI00313B7FE2
MRTALVYHEEMTAARLLWEDPECEIERPERLTAALERLQQGGLEQRCLQLAAREASEAELGLVHRSDPGEPPSRGGRLARGAAQPARILKTEHLPYLPRFHHWVGGGGNREVGGPTSARPLLLPFLLLLVTLPCLPAPLQPRVCVPVARNPGLGHGGTTGAVWAVRCCLLPPEYLPLCPAGRGGRAAAGGCCADRSRAQWACPVFTRRPPGHHSQRAAANGFCVFNNVAIAAKHAQQKHGLQRILIVDWDVHHGQGIQYIFEDDPSVLYFSWHRYEHGCFWPYLQESDADAVGLGQGRGFTVNLPWNQVGMGNADYMAAFLHVLLPVAFEFDPELVLVSAGFDSAVGDPEGQMQATPECFAHLTQLLQVLAGGRVCAVLEGGYHLESLSQSVCMVVKALLGDPAPPLSGSMVPRHSALESIQSVRAAQAPHWTSLQQQGPARLLNPSTCSPEGRRPSVSPGGPGFKAAEAQGSAVPRSLLDQLHLYPTPPARTAAALTAQDAALVLPPDVLRPEGSAPQEETRAWARLHEALAQDTAFIALGKVLHLLNGILDGQVSSGIATTPAAAATLEVAIRHGLSHRAQRVLCVAVGQLDRPPDLASDGRNLWLNIRGKEAAALSMFHVSVPLPGTTGGFLSCILALVLPLAYGFQPDLVLVALGPAHGLQDPQAALLAALLRGPAGGRVLVLVEQRKTQREREHKRGVGEGEAGSRRAGSPMRGWIPGLRDHDLGRRQTPNRLSHPGAQHCDFWGPVSRRFFSRADKFLSSAALTEQSSSEKATSQPGQGLEHPRPERGA